METPVFAALLPPLAAPPASSPTPVSPPPPISPCGGVPGEFALLYRSAPAPPAVRTENATGCVAGADEEGVSYASSQSRSASQFEVTVAIPGGTVDDARALSAFFLQASVTGVPCSLDGRSVLQIDLLPPGSPIGSSAGNVWTVVTPVWDLVPAGSCDPRCENSSVAFSIGGHGFCEDNALRGGVGSPGYASNPLLSPGDTVRFTIHPGAGRGLTVYMNDTTHPSSSAHWQYGNTTTLTGLAVEPFDSTASSTAGWALGGDVSAGWTNCPVGNASSSSSCVSYDPLTQHSLSFPSIVNTTFYDPIRSGYLGLYDSLGPWSSSGACSGDVNATGCASFSLLGTPGLYPTISLVGASGSASLVYGSNASGAVGTIARPGTGFHANASVDPLDPAILTAIKESSNGTIITLSARATDPRGVFDVAFGAVWCFNGGSSTVPTSTVTDGTRGAGPFNGSEDANWTANFPRGSNTTGGTLYYTVREYDGPTDPGTAPVYGRASLSGGALTCGSILPPPAGAGAITPVGGGYRVSWAFLASDLPMVRNFSLVAVPPSGPGVVATVPDATTRTAVVDGLRPGVAHTIYIGVTTVDGTTISVGRTPGYPSPPVLPVFQGTAALNTSALTQPSDSVSLSLTASGGKVPYSFHVAWGNGSSTWLYNAGAAATLPRSLPGYIGVARILVRANDSVGDVVAFAPLALEVRATALGVPLALSAGENRVGLTWNAPASPTSPVTSYSVFFTEDPLGVGLLTTGWPNNLTGAHPVVVFNTTGRSAFFSAIDGEPFYAAVLAWTSAGLGLLPPSGVAAATPAPFTLISFGPQASGSLGGPAPLTVAFTAEATSGGLDPVTQADFSVFALGLDVTATPSSLVGPSGSTSWANASVTFPTAGTFRVALHLEDAEFDPPLVSLLTVYVGPGAAPDLTVSITTPEPFAGHPVDLVATASGSPGPYTLSWQFGDGSSLASTGPSVSHTYAVGGAYTVTVSAKDNGTLGRATIAQPVEILTPPSVRIIAAAGAASVLTWSFQADVVGGSGPPTLSWSFGDGLVAAGALVNHTFTKVGTYTVRLNLTDLSGLTARDTLALRVGLLATPGSAASSNSDMALVIALAIGLVVAAALAVLFYVRGRPPKVSPVADPATYTLERSRPKPAPPDGE